MCPELLWTVWVFQAFSLCWSLGGTWGCYSRPDGWNSAIPWPEEWLRCCWGIPGFQICNWENRHANRPSDAGESFFLNFFSLFIFYFFWIICDPMGGKHSAMYRSRSTVLISICSFQAAGQIPGWLSLSWSSSAWDLHWERFALQEPNPPTFLSQGEEIQPHISSSLELVTIWWSWAQSFKMLSIPMGT